MTEDKKHGSHEHKKEAHSEHKDHKEHEHKKEDHQHKKEVFHEPKHHAHHHKKEEPKKCCDTKLNIWTYATIILGILFIASLLTSGFSGNNLDSCAKKITNMKEKGTVLGEYADVALKAIDAMTIIDKETTSYKGDQVKLDFYVMSQCPYGTQVVDAIAPVKEKLGDALDLNIDFIANDLGDGSFQSLHGQPEVEGNIAQLCAMEYNPNTYLDMLVCMNKNARAIPANWEKCAEDNSLDVANIKKCYEGSEGKELHSKSVAKAEAVQASGSPTIYLNDIKYNGGRGEKDFLRSICNEFKSGAPEACLNIPKPKKVKMIVISDERCVDCDSSGVTGQLKSLFPGLEVVIYDYNDKKGKKLYDETGVQYLPALLFDESVKDEEGYANVANYLVKTGDYLNLAVGAVFDPTAEICNNEVDDDGNGQIDCADSACSGEWQCMEKKEVPEVDLFVMSHCPYGTQMEKGVLPVMELMGDKVNFNFRYVYYVMHGKTEVDEQLLQYCIQKDNNELFLDYITCFLEDGETDTCLAEVGLTKKGLQTCMDETDSEFGIYDSLNDKSSWLSGNYPLFNTDKELNEKYGVGGSPTFVINGVKVDGQGRDPQSVLDTVCLGFENKPSECDEILSTAGFNPGFGFDQVVAPSGATAPGCEV